MIDIDAVLNKARESLDNNQPLAALQILDQAISHDQSDPQLWTMKGQIHHYFLGQPDGAEDSYLQALYRDPEQLNALGGLGELVHGTSRQELSLNLMDRALAIDPNAVVPLILSVAGRLLSANQLNRAECISRIKRFIKQDPPLYYLIKAAYWVPFLDIDKVLEEGIWEIIRHKFPHAKEKTYPESKQIDRGHSRIRVGYVSPNFGDHSIGHVTNRLFESHDRDRFEIQVYATGRMHEQSEYKEHIQKTSERYISLEGVQTSQACDIILNNEVDILVDLNGYMGSSQIIEIFSHRPAPVQVYWLGHGGALGLPFYDYVIGDPIVTPAEEDNRYIESVVRLPEVFAPADPHEIYQGNAKRPDFNLKDNCIVFCVFNNHAKIDSLAMDAWMQILKEVPESQLWLSGVSSLLVTKNLKAAAAERGVAAERLIFADRVPDKRQHFARLRLADLFLDTFTVNAATTAIDAVWAGVPVLTRPGSHFCARIGASVVKAVGLEDMICATTDEYVKRAIHLARNPEELDRVRQKLKSHLPQSILFNPHRFTRQLEAAYSQMWDQVQSGKMPVSFDVNNS